MLGKTVEVRSLVQDVLQTLSKPYGEDIILKVCQEIERKPNFKKRYDDLGEQLRPWVVNNWIGKHTKDLTGMKSLRQVSAPDSVHIITSYTKLGR